MSSKNDPESAAGAALMAGFVIISLLLFFLAAVLSFVLTVMCLTALKDEKTYFGNTITPREAKLFIGCGLIGAAIIGAFGEMLYNGGTLLEQNRPWMPVIGYVIGSIIYGYAEATHQQQQEAAAKEAELMAPIAKPNGPSPYFMTVEEQEAQRRPPFRYASWDDEETR